MARLRLERRTLLRGLGGAAVALPLLEAMPAAAQTAAPNRYVIVLGGHSLGCDGKPPQLFVPDTVGPNYDLKECLKPLNGSFGDLRPDISVVSKLKIPWDTGGGIPPGGRPTEFHCSNWSPLLSGVQSTGTGATCRGPTTEQIAADTLGLKPLIYRAQVGFYVTGYTAAGRDLFSYRRDAQGRLGPVPAIVSPRAAFDGLFANFTPPSLEDSIERERAAFLRARRLSILDLVRGDTERLIPKLGRQDQVRMERHLDELRDLENRVLAVPPPPPSSGQCVKPPDPGPDPAIGSDATCCIGGYSDEETRATVLVDLIHMALVCDLARSSALMLTMPQSHLSMYPFTGVRMDLHELGHGSGTPLAQAQGIAWNVKHYARLVSKLKATTEGGVSLLDRTAVVYLPEGGYGLDPTDGALNQTHSTENMAALVAGRVGGLRPGRHVVASAARQHPANVLATVLNAVGVNTTSLGEVGGLMDELR